MADPTTPRGRGNSHLVRDLVRDLSVALRETVLPMLGSHAGRAHAGELSAGGDVTFRIDEEAEALLETWLAERAPDVAFYSEDRGLVRRRRLFRARLGCVRHDSDRDRAARLLRRAGAAARGRRARDGGGVPPYRRRRAAQQLALRPRGRDAGARGGRGDRHRRL